MDAAPAVRNRPKPVGEGGGWEAGQEGNEGGDGMGDTEAEGGGCRPQRAWYRKMRVRWALLACRRYRAARCQACRAMRSETVMRRWPLCRRCRNGRACWLTHLIGMPTEIAMRHRTPHFAHVFSGGYSAGYYSYIWSEVLDADTVEWFAENGGNVVSSTRRMRCATCTAIDRVIGHRPPTHPHE